MPSQLDSELLRTFVAIADCGSFTRAAEIVGRTQSAVSMQVKRLEATVGWPLFRRARSGVSLTEPGERLLSKARRVVRLLDQALDSLDADPLAGSLAVGIPEEFGASLLPLVLARFAERHSGVQVTVRCETSPALQDAVARGELDLAVLVIDTGRAEGEVLLRDPTLWMTSARHPTQEREPLPVAMFEPGCWWRDWALRSLDEQGRDYRVVFTSASVAGIQAAVTAGLAVAVLGRSMTPPGVRLLGPEEGFAELPASSIVLRAKHRRPSAAAAHMAEVIRSAFRGRLAA